MNKLIITISFLIITAMFQSAQGQSDSSSIYTFVDAFKREKLLTLSVDDTLFISINYSLNNKAKYFLVNNLLESTKNKTVCDKPRASNHCMKIYLNYDKPTKVEFRLTNWSTYSGIMIVELNEGEYVVKKMYYLTSSH